MDIIDWIRDHAFAIGLAAVWLLAIYSAARAILYTRTPQGATAWVLALLLMPVLTLPFYWVFGHTRFQGYVSRRQVRISRASERIAVKDTLDAATDEPGNRHRELHTLARRLGAGGFTRGNHLELLIDGEATFDTILTAIADAREFVLIQFYIFRDDSIGRRVQQALIERARAGVRVCFLYERIGSRLSNRFLAGLDQAGIHCHHFDPGRKGSRFQINFRNHRKILVVDGHTAFLGGFNVGDDYLGRYRRVGRWRDTHLRVRGPAAAQAQIAFFKDWYWATDELPDARFHIAPAGSEDDGHALVWATGPADAQPECLLYLLAAINQARSRVWIANPYFVPPGPILHALRLALVRGVEVRLLVPERNDNRLVHLASQVHLADMINCGAEIHRWSDGFMHQKTLLVDDDLAIIGTVNLDSRSVFINFEVSALSAAPDFVERVERMLERDFGESTRASIQDFRDAGYARRLLCRAANLLSPML